MRISIFRELLCDFLIRPPRAREFSGYIEVVINMLKRLRSVALALPAFLVSQLAGPAVAADGFEQHAAHEHGKVTLNIVFEAKRLTIELDSPAVNVVGFEHEPRSKDEQSAVAAANTYLRDSRKLFGFPPQAKCRVAGADLKPPHWESDAEEDHDAHEQHEAHEDHADFEATYLYDCESPEHLAWLEPWLLEQFRNVTEARVNVITASGQRSTTVTQARARIALR
jgi:hypothetical protein